MKPLPLRLALEPLLPSRTPTVDDCFEYGFRLRQADRPAIERNDPLLRAFGACVDRVNADEVQEEALQSDAFDPGCVVRLLAEPFDPDDADAIGVWDAEGLRQAGTLAGGPAARVSAAMDVGLEQRGLVLIEHRTAGDDRRERVSVLIHSPSLVRVAVPRNLRVARPEGRGRPRLVLIADESGDVRWWDPSVAAGPLPTGELPLSPELRRDLELRGDFAALAEESDGQRGFDRVETDWERDGLRSKAAELWRRARSELGRRYAVGFLASGMRRPVWSPSELDQGDSDDETEFPF